MASSDKTGSFSTTKWLAVVGIGADGVAGLGDHAKTIIAEAELVFGGQRHLDMVAPLMTGSAAPWPAPFDSEMKAVIRERGRKVCVLASGDPFNHGVGTTLTRYVDPAEMIVIPAPSSFSLAAARLGWALNEVETISLHGRAIERIRPLLHHGRRILALTSDGAAPADIAKLLADSGFSSSAFTVLERLGAQDERILSHRAGAIGDQRFADLNIVAIEVVAGPGAQVLPLGFGLPDDLFAHDGQITKREIRAATLSALAPQRGQLLWDIGAGSGSVSIEWMLAHPSMRSIAIEHHPERARRISENAKRLGVPDLKIVECPAPAALDGLEQPEAIFIGGGGSRDGILDHAAKALRAGGRLVANAVTLEMEAALLAFHGRFGGDLLRISISRAEPVGQMSGWRPAMPVTQLIWVKP